MTLRAIRLPAIIGIAALCAACTRSENNSIPAGGPADAGLPAFVESTDTANPRHSVEIDPAYGKPQDMAGLAESAPVLRAAADDARLLGQALKCWPQTRVSALTYAPMNDPAKVEDAAYGAIGLRKDLVSCDVPPPRDLPTGYAEIGDNMSISPLGQFRKSLPVLPLLDRAFARHEIPMDAPPSIMRRRWRSELRIRPPDDRVMADALRRIVGDRHFAAALDGLSVKLTAFRPNAVILGYRGDGACIARQVCDAVDRRGANGAVDGARAAHDDLARRLTSGRRNWFHDGSDVSTAVPIGGAEREKGFAVGSGLEIEGAACLVPDFMIDARWRHETPQAAMAMPSYRQKRAALCLLRILGVSGYERDVRHRDRRDHRDLDLVMTRGSPEDPTVVFGRAAFAALRAIYVSR